MLQQLVPAFRMTLLLTILTGLIYPGLVTGLCQVLFRAPADGSLIVQNGEVRGSVLLGQNFTKPEYFHLRPSAAGKDGYDPTSSSGSNYGPTSQKLMDRMKASAEQFHKDNPEYHGAIPADAITASGSGLDPEITIGNAQAQVARVAKARGVSNEVMQQVVNATAESRDLGFLGEARVNAVKLNLNLDARFSKGGNSR